MTIVTSANQISLPQLISHSIYYHIFDKLASDGLDSTMVRVKESYPITGVVVNAPSIIIDEGDFADSPLEIGGVDIASIGYIIDIFGKSKTQRNTLAWLVRAYLNDERIPVKDYNEGFPPGITNQTTLGHAEIMNVRMITPIILTEGEIPEEMRLLRQLVVDCQYMIS